MRKKINKNEMTKKGYKSYCDMKQKDVICKTNDKMKDKLLKERIREELIKVYGYGRIDESNPKRTMQDSIEGLDQALQAILTEIKRGMPEKKISSEFEDLQRDAFNEGYNAYHDEMEKLLE